MRTFRERVRASRDLLPPAPLARAAAVAFSLCVLSLLFSLAVSQALLAAAGLLYFAHLLRDKPGVKFPPIKLPLALFCLFTVLSALASTSPAAGGFAIRKLALFLIFLLATNLISDGAHLEWLYRGLFVESALVGIVGAGQFVEQYRSVRRLHPHRVYNFMVVTRIHGFMGHWMNFGGQQMLAFVALAAFLLIAPRVRRIWWIVAGIIALSLVLNFTRGVWLASFVAAVYLIVRSKPRWLLALPVLFALGYVAAPSLVRKRVWRAFHPTHDPALAIRFEMWHVALRMIQKHPWLGVGPDTIEENYDLYLPSGKPPEPGYHGHLHDNFLQFGAERGLPCLAAWLWMMGALAASYWKMRRRIASRLWIVEAALAGWLALMIEGCFEFNFGTSPVLMLFLFIASTPFVVGSSDVSLVSRYRRR